MSCDMALRMVVCLANWWCRLTMTSEKVPAGVLWLSHLLKQKTHWGQANLAWRTYRLMKGCSQIKYNILWHITTQSPLNESETKQVNFIITPSRTACIVILCLYEVICQRRFYLKNKPICSCCYSDKGADSAASHVWALANVYECLPHSWCYILMILYSSSITCGA